MRRTSIVTLLTFILCAALVLSSCASEGLHPVGGDDMPGSGSSSLAGNTAPSVPSEPESTSSQAQLSGSSPESQADGEPEPITVIVTVPEGYTLARIAMLMEEKGICGQDEFITASQEGDFSSFPLIAALDADEHRCFQLEGYLFPDTYEFYLDESPVEVLSRFLENAERRISEEIRTAAAECGYTVNELLTLASIIQKESNSAAVMSDVSSVLHNRLADGMRLQCDVTITYVEGAIKPFITGDPDRYNAYYNTYKCAALPAGPICNPGLEAIDAALSPSNTPYYFFIADRQGNYLFAEDWDTHLQNIEDAGI